MAIAADSGVWASHADDLAKVVQKYMVNRDDAHGGYFKKGGAVSPVTKKKTDMLWRPLSEKIVPHFKPKSSGYIIGLHAINPEDSCCRWLAFDVDRHDDSDDAQQNHLVAISLADDLEQVGLCPLIWDSDGRGGYHVMAVFDRPHPAAHCKFFGESLAAKYPGKIEVFPKQTGLDVHTPFGNWLRLFGKHPKHDHWMRLWSEDTWLSAEGTVLVVLALEPSDPSSIPKAASSVSTAKVGAVVGLAEAIGEEWPATERVKAFMREKPLSNRNNAIFACACDLKGAGWDRQKIVDLLTPKALEYGHDPKRVDLAIKSAIGQPRQPAEIPESLVESPTVIQLMAGLESPESTHIQQESVVNAPPTPVTGPETPVNTPHIRQEVTPSHYILRNHVVRFQPDPQDPSKMKKKIYAIPNERILSELSAATNGFPKREADVLFVPDKTGRHPIYITDSDALFAWASDSHWAGGMGFDARLETTVNLSTANRFFLYAHSNVGQFARAYSTPHHPPMEGCYYFPSNLPEPTGNKLIDLVNMFNPETEDDRALLAAALVTPASGLSPGARPIFLLTSDHGPGSGKTSTAEAICRVWDKHGPIRSSPDQKDYKELMNRCLDRNARYKRTVLKDNVRGVIKLTELESMVTASYINGKQMYVGDTERLNDLTWFITANVPTLGRDLAERSIIIKIGKPIGTNFIQAVNTFINEYREDIQSDCLAFLKQEEKCKICELSRWGEWETKVLSRFVAGDSLSKICRERRSEVDSDAEAGSDLESVIEDLVGTLGLNESQPVFFATTDLMAILKDNGLIYHGSMARGATIYLKEQKQAGLLPRLKHHRLAHSRGWLWFPDPQQGLASIVRYADQRSNYSDQRGGYERYDN